MRGVRNVHHVSLFNRLSKGHRGIISTREGKVLLQIILVGNGNDLELVSCSRRRDPRRGNSKLGRSTRDGVPSRRRSDSPVGGLVERSDASSRSEVSLSNGSGGEDELEGRVGGGSSGRVVQDDALVGLAMDRARGCRRSGVLVGRVVG